MRAQSEQYDVIVVGLGAMGSSTAAELAERGVDVLGLERFDLPHTKGSSHGITRIIRLPQYEGSAYVPLVRRSLERWKEIDESYSNQLFHRTGTLDFGPPGSDVFEGSKESCETHAIPHEILGGADVSERFPGYALPDEYRAVYQPDGGFLHAEQCIVANTERAHDNGAVLHAREEVTDWTTESETVHVSTDRGEYTAESMIVTAGARTGQLLPSLSPVLEPERQVLGWFQPTAPKQFSPERFPVFVADIHETRFRGKTKLFDSGDVPTGHYYGFPIYEVPGFKIGKFHHREETGTPAEIQREPTRADEDVLRRFVETYVPHGNGPTMQLSTCMFTNSPDGDFLIDTHPNHENVYIGAGFSGHGFKFASIVGEILADLAVGGNTDHPIDPFRLSRFP